VAGPWHPRELLRPPPHRGPLIAAGAVLITVGLALVELRTDDLADGWRALILGSAAALVLGLGVQAPNEGGRPPAYQSVLLVCGLLLAYVGLLHLGGALNGDGGPGAGLFVWTGLVQAGLAGWIAAYRRSAIAALISAVAAGIALLAAVDWIFDPSGFAAARWILLLLAGVLVLTGLVLRAGRPRHAELLIDAAALAILAIAGEALVGVVIGVFAPFGTVPTAPLPGFWELVVLGAGCGLVAFGAVDRSPGPAWLGVANLLAFVVLVGQGDSTLHWWPVTLLVLGAATMLAGLRPRAPLPPPPEPGAYRAGEQPLAARTADDDTIVVRVRDDRPASG
jgi:hypothetical protein